MEFLRNCYFCFLLYGVLKLGLFTFIITCSFHFWTLFFNTWQFRGDEVMWPLGGSSLLQWINHILVYSLIHIINLHISVSILQFHVTSVRLYNLTKDTISIRSTYWCAFWSIFPCKNLNLLMFYTESKLSLYKCIFFLNCTTVPR